VDLLIRVYRANPLRPHCSAVKHVWLCALLFGVEEGNTRCPAKNA
jgi:hypothetical protein